MNKGDVLESKPVQAPPASAHYAPVFAVVATMVVVLLAIWLAITAWDYYQTTPWTRDARVRAFTVVVAPQVSGQVTQIDVHDNQEVKVGQVLMRIDPADFQNALAAAQAQLAADEASAQMKAASARRRAQAPLSAVSAENRQDAASEAKIADAAVTADEARVAQAQLNLARSVVYAPVNGVVTNLSAHVGDYAHTGEGMISVVDTQDIWVTGYFEETELSKIKPGDQVRIKLMAYPNEIIDGHVQGIGRGIAIPNAENGPSGLPDVDPIYAWVRLTQRLPVHITLDHVPADIQLSVGMTASAQIVEPKPNQ